MSTSPLSVEVFEDAVSDIFSHADKPLTDSDFDRLSDLLVLRDKREWALRPRTYAVLRLMNRLDVMGTFIHKGFNDFHIPYHVDRLSSIFRDSSSREEFTEKQILVMTKESGKAYDLERSQGRHRHLSYDADSHFHVVRLLGRGGFGEVDCVRSKLSLREYARKRVHRVKTFGRQENSALKQFENEVHALKRLDHHHLVKFIGSYTDPKYVGLITSPVADCDLRAFLDRKPLNKSDAELLRGFFGCLCSAVLYLHKHKCRHKDIKPGNILVKGQTVFLTDFGTARDWTEMSKSTTVGKPGPLTRGYAAPEVMDWGPRNSSADIYSLGIVFLDMASILNGESLESKDQFLADNGTKELYPGKNEEAVILWLKRLSKGRERGPVTWIRRMVTFLPKDRKTAVEVMDDILNPENDRVYYSSCCNGEDVVGDEIGACESADEMDPSSEMTLSASADEMAIQTSKTDHGSSDLFQAVTRGNLVDFNILIQRQADVHERGPHGKSLLHIAAAHGHTMIISRLLDLGLEIETQTHDEWTALHTAALNDHRPATQMLLEQRANVDARNHSGNTPLMIAALNNNVEIIAQLLSKGANINAKNDKGSTSLHQAIESTQHAAVFALLERLEIEVDARMRDGWTPLHCAANIGVEIFVESLLSQGADIQAVQNESFTPLHLAARRGHEEAVRVLLVNGANSDAACSCHSITPLHLAAQAGEQAIIWLLLENGANIEATSVSSITPLLAAAKSANDIGLIRVLLSHGADASAANSEGFTALHYAVENNDAHLLQFLLEHFIQHSLHGLDFPDQYGKTPLHSAAEYGYSALVALLADHGADTEAKNDRGGTPLWMAAESGHADIVEVLVLRGADIDAPNKDSGFTTVFQAAYYGHADVIKALMNFGANMTARANTGFMPIYNAVMTNQKETLKLFLDHGLYDEDMLQECLRCACTDGHDDAARLLVQAGANTNGFETTVQLLVGDMQDGERDLFFKDTRSIKKLCGIFGLESNFIRQAYLLCDHDEDLARTLLLEIFEGINTLPRILASTHNPQPSEAPTYKRKPPPPPKKPAHLRASSVAKEQSESKSNVAAQNGGEIETSVCRPTIRIQRLNLSGAHLSTFRLSGTGTEPDASMNASGPPIHSAAAQKETTYAGTHISSNTLTSTSGRPSPSDSFYNSTTEKPSNEEDPDLQEAISASLSTGSDSLKAQREPIQQGPNRYVGRYDGGYDTSSDDEDEADLQKAIAASLNPVRPGCR